MIKALLRSEKGSDLLVVGLTHSNILRLQQGRDMVIDLEPIGIKGTNILITIGAVEEDILLRLREQYSFDIGDFTEVNEKPKGYTV